MFRDKAEKFLFQESEFIKALSTVPGRYIIMAKMTVR